ncbi:MAG TPA: adenylate/guanylate cyclase domain-containing protein, partial [Leptospiraceae bacterium]|nr:adenylate/guanylate cyclase domain-containing protein [Leptospiraceae bacterium]
MQLEEKNGVLFGWASYGGWKAQWEEEKWQWNYLSSMKAGRIYSRGPGRYVRSIVLFRKVDENKTEITVYFGWVPSGWIGAIVLRWKMPELLLLYGREIEKITQAAEPGKEVYEEIQI